MASSLTVASYGDESPIAAFATVPGKSALTVIRCSGKDAIDLAALVFSPAEKLKNAQGNMAVHGWIVRDGKKIDEVIAVVFRGPKSFTGEDGLDISCHGGLSVGRAVMEALHSAGFRDALPGEFTFRAFMNGKLDLTRSESVMELVAAKTEIGRSHAVNRLSGALETEINDIKKMLVQVLSGAEIYLDYSEDEIGAEADEAAGRLPEQELVKEALARLARLAASWQRERLYQEGILAVIAGRPNAGKSSLFNAFLREDRSIVTEIPGTTRDWIEAWVSIEGIPVRLADTAGLRDSSDPVEKLGVARSRELVEQADVVLYLIDGTQGFTDEDAAFLAHANNAAALLPVWNKADLAPLPFPLAADNLPCADPIGVSAKTGEGLAELGRAIAAAAQADRNLHSSVKLRGEIPLELTHMVQNAALGSQRQKNLIDAACAALDEALALAARNEALDLIAPLLREAVNALGEITGEVSTADILEEMFSRFCVGK